MVGLDKSDVMVLEMPPVGYEPGHSEVRQELPRQPLVSSATGILFKAYAQSTNVF